MHHRARARARKGMIKKIAIMVHLMDLIHLFHVYIHINCASIAIFTIQQVIFRRSIFSFCSSPEKLENKQN